MNASPRQRAPTERQDGDVARRVELHAAIRLYCSAEASIGRLSGRTTLRSRRCLAAAESAWPRSAWIPARGLLSYLFKSVVGERLRRDLKAPRSTPSGAARDRFRDKQDSDAISWPSSTDGASRLG